MQNQQEQGDSTGGLIPYKNAPALISYYLGILSLLCGFATGIPAVILGVMGLRKYKQTPIVRGVAHAWIGIVLGGGMTLIWLAVGVLMVIAAAIS